MTPEILVNNSEIDVPDGINALNIAKSAIELRNSSGANVGFSSADLYESMIRQRIESFEQEDLD